MERMARRLGLGLLLMAMVWLTGTGAAQARTVLVDVSVKDPPATCAAFSQDGKTLALLSAAGLQVFDATTGTARKTMPTKEIAYQCALSPDGKLFALVNNGLSVVDLESGKIALKRNLVTGRFARVGVAAAFSLDGKDLMVVSDGGYFSFRLGAVIAETHTEELAAASAPASSMTAGPAAASFTPDAHHLLLAYRNDQIDLMDVSTPDKPVLETRLSARELGGTKLEYPTLAPDGQHFVGLVKSAVVAWSITDAAALFRRPARASLPRFAYAPASRDLVLNTEPGNVAVVVDAMDGKEIRRLVGTRSAPDVVFSPAGDRCVSIEQEIGALGDSKDLRVMVTLDNWAGAKGTSQASSSDARGKEKTGKPAKTAARPPE